MNKLVKTTAGKFFLFSFFILTFVFWVYLNTMMPSQAFHDAGEFQTFVYTMDVTHPTGYPTYILLGKAMISLIPFGEVAWKVNYLSVIYSILTLFLFGLFLLKISKNYFIAAVSILLLAFNKDFWNYAGIADPHTLDRLFLFLLLNIFLYLANFWQSKLIFVFTILLGIGLGNHLFLIYSVPGILIWYLILLINKEIVFKIKDLLVAALGLISGLLIYFYLPFKASTSKWILTPDYSLNTWGGFKRHVFGEDFQGLMFQGGGEKVLQNMSGGMRIFIDNISITLFAVGILGLLILYKKYFSMALGLTVMFAAFLAFSTNYVVSSPERYYLSYLAIYLIFIGFGFGVINEILIKFLKRNKLVNPNISYLLVCLMILFFGAFSLVKNYESVDKSKQFEADRYSKKIFANVSKDSVVLSWWNYSTPLWYRQYILKEREDILIVNKSPAEWDNYINEFFGNRPVYVVESGYVADKYNLKSEGGVYRVVGPKE